jgi:hypothetical protein
MLFSDLSLETEKECLFWNAKFVAHPHLAPAVRSLSLHGDEFENDDPENDEYDDQVQGIFIRSDALLELAKRLVNVTSLEISDFFSWGERETQVIANFRRVTWLKISRTTDLAWMAVQCFENLKALSLLALNLDPSDSPSLSWEFPSLIRLQKIEVFDTCTEMVLFCWLRRHPFDLGRLHTVALSWAYNHQGRAELADDFTAFLDSVSQTVENLSLRITPTCRSPTPNSDPGPSDFCLCALRRLTCP